jgi:hypothetical protein
MNASQMMQTWTELSIIEASILSGRSVDSNDFGQSGSADSPSQTDRIELLTSSLQIPKLNRVSKRPDEGFGVAAKDLGSRRIWGRIRLKGIEHIAARGKRLYRSDLW